jgi:hypothetical protein
VMYVLCELQEGWFEKTAWWSDGTIIGLSTRPTLSLPLPPHTPLYRGSNCTGECIEQTPESRRIRC